MNQARALFYIATYNTSDRPPPHADVRLVDIPSAILILLKAHSFGRRLFLVDTNFYWYKKLFNV